MAITNPTTPLRYRTAVRDGRETYEHRVIAERALGRPLPKGAAVHHVDGDGLNNANSNLVICQDHRYHLLLHKRTRVVRAGGNPNTDAFCGRCQTAKPLSEFYVRKTDCLTVKAGAATNVCRDCSIAAGRAHTLQKNPNAKPRPRRWFTLHGRTQNLKAWSAESGLSAELLKHRLARGWPLERALATPVVRDKDGRA